MAKLRDCLLTGFARVQQAGRGQGYTEYVIILALIAVAAYAAVQLLGNNVSTAMNGTAGSV